MAKKTIGKKVVEKPVVKSNQHPDYPEFISLPYALAHKASRSDRRIRILLMTQVAEHKEKLKKATKKK